MNEIDGVANAISTTTSLSSSIGPGGGGAGGERTTAEKRERAMAEAALTLAEIRTFYFLHRTTIHSITDDDVVIQKIC